MKPVSLSEGAGRTRVDLFTKEVGTDLAVFITNHNGHIGAVALAEYCPEETRASTSVITRFGHKDDAVAHMAAHTLCKKLKKPVCAVAGIHIDNITESEIGEIIRNCEIIVERLAAALEKRPPAVGGSF